MDTNKGIEEKLDQYLLGQMSEAERTDFTKALDKDPDLVAQFALHQQIVDGVKTYARQDFRKKLKNFQKEWNKKQAVKAPVVETPAKVKPLYRRVTTWAAAAAALILLLSVAFWLNQAPLSSGDLYAAYYEPYPSLFSNRNVTEGDLPLANEYYQNKDYEKALGIFDQLLVEQPNDAKLLLIAGICQLENDQAAAALTYFQKIIDKEDLYLMDQATWYAALSHLKQDQKTKAKALLKQLEAKPKADRKNEAIELLNEMR